MKILAFILLTFLSPTLVAQDLVHWTAQFDEEGAQLVIHAEMEEGWHIYSQHIDPEAGPIPTSFEFQHGKGIQLIESTVEEEPIESYDPNFGSTVLYFENQTNFSQKLVATETGEVTCIVTFMVCNDSTCYPPEDVVISVKIPKTTTTK